MTPTQPSILEVMVNSVSCMGVFSATRGISPPLCMMSEAFCRKAPSFPPGWRCLKSVCENPRRSSKAMAKMSPRTIVAVVEEVGARPKGQASPSLGSSSQMSAAFPKALSLFLVIPISGMP